MFQPSTLNRLTTLILNCSDTKAVDMVLIGKYGVNLEVLSIYDMSRCTSRSFLSLYKGCPKLKKLYIDLEGKRIHQKTHKLKSSFSLH